MNWNPAASLPPVDRDNRLRASARINRSEQRRQARQRMQRIAADVRRKDPDFSNPGRTTNRGKCRAVIRTATDGTEKQYASLTAAAADVGRKEPQNVWRAIKLGGKCAGYHWRYA